MLEVGLVPTIIKAVVVDPTILPRKEAANPKVVVVVVKKTNPRKENKILRLVDTIRKTKYVFFRRFFRHVWYTAESGMLYRFRSKLWYRLSLYATTTSQDEYGYSVVFENSYIYI